MPQIKCPACEWQTDDLDVAYAAVQAAQLNIHSQTMHRQDVTAQKVKLDPPEVDRFQLGTMGIIQETVRNV